MALRIGAAVVKYARTITRYPVGYCLKYVRTCFGIASKYPSAINAWNNAKHRHGPTSAIPYGVPVFFKGGKYGHVALSLGKNAQGVDMCRSTDYPRAGVVGEVPIRTLAANWNYPYIGWTEDLNGVRVYTPPPTKPAFPAYPADGREAFEVGDRGEHVKVLQVALSRSVTGVMTQEDINATQRYQERHSPVLAPSNGRVNPATYASFRTFPAVRARWRV